MSVSALFTALTRRCRPALLALMAIASGSVRADLPTEELSVATLPPADVHRLYLADLALPHLNDGRLMVLDGKSMRVLGLIGTGFGAVLTRSPDKGTIYVATTYYSRLQRGTRTDVVEVYDAATLAFEYEIEIPPKHVQALPNKPMALTSADSRFLLIQNATPATSITVVDLPNRRVVGEIAAPGCWGMMPWPQHPHRFASLCGDGTLATIDLADDGATAKISASTAFFDPDKDPVFSHYELVGKELYLVSFLGMLHRVSLEDDGPHFSAPWSLLTAREAGAHWRPGGVGLFAIDPATQRLYVGMHDHGHDGSHKEPATQLWSFDLATRRHLASLPGHGSIGLALEHVAKPHLYVIDGVHNAVLSFDPVEDPGLRKPLARLDKAGDTPVVLEAQ